MTVSIQHYLKPAEQQAYSAYVAVRMAHMEAGTHCWQRLGRAGDLIKLKLNTTNELPSIDHAIAYSPPGNQGGAATICHPSPRCIYELMIGGVHAPVDAHLTSKLLLINSDGSGDVMEKWEAGRYRRVNDVVGEYVVDYRRVHDETLPPLSYEDAIEWVMQKDVPHEVWSSGQGFAIVNRSSIPKDRTNRNAWKLKDFIQ